jgi:hypothetical protein
LKLRRVVVVVVARVFGDGVEADSVIVVVDGGVLSQVRVIFFIIVFDLLAVAVAIIVNVVVFLVVVFFDELGANLFIVLFVFTHFHKLGVNRRIEDA